MDGHRGRQAQQLRPSISLVLSDPRRLESLSRSRNLTRLKPALAGRQRIDWLVITYCLRRARMQVPGKARDGRGSIASFKMSLHFDEDERSAAD
jgi:hypothetical protein